MKENQIIELVSIWQANKVNLSTQKKLGERYSYTVYIYFIWLHQRVKFKLNSSVWRHAIRDIIRTREGKKCRNVNTYSSQFTVITTTATHNIFAIKFQEFPATSCACNFVIVLLHCALLCVLDAYVKGKKF